MYRDAINVSGPLVAESEGNGGETFRFYLPGGTFSHTYSNQAGHRFYRAGPGKLVWRKRGGDGQQDDATIYYQLTPSNQLLVSGLYPDHPDLYSAKVQSPPFEVVQINLKFGFTSEADQAGRVATAYSLFLRPLLAGRSDAKVKRRLEPLVLQNAPSWPFGVPTG